MTLSSTRRNGFLCYAHRGGRSPSRDYVEQLQLHLNLVEPRHEHRAWWDQDLTGGEDWPIEIRNALDAAAYAVLFVNVESLNSEFVTQVELPALLDAAQREGLLLLPLLVGDCLLPDWLARIQFLNHEEGPLDSMRSSKRNRVLKGAAARIQGFLNGDGQPSQAVRLMDTVASTCTPRTSGAMARSSLLVGESSDAALDAVEELAEALSETRSNQLCAIRERYLRGERGAGIVALEQLINSPGWDLLDASVRGRILRTAALYRLDAEQDLAAAEDLAKSAALDDPEGDQTPLDAHLALRRDGVDAAISLLEQPKSHQALHLKAALLIEHGEPEKALALLSWTPESAQELGEPTAETWRLRGLAHLERHHLTDAIEAIDQAKELNPDWLAVRAAAAIVAFWRACTPAALTFRDQPLWPMPFPRVYVCVDSTALARLQEAEQTFADVAALLNEGSIEERHWSAWRLIALLLLGNRAQEATALADRLLRDMDPATVWPLLWGHVYGLKLDWSALKPHLRATPIDDSNFAVLNGIYFEICIANGEDEAVLEQLSALEPLLLAKGQQDVLARWRVVALTDLDKTTEARQIADAIEDEGLRLRLRLYVARELERTERGSHCAAIDALLAVDSGPDVLGEACEAHARAGGWSFVSAHADALIEAAPTPSSLRLLVSAAWEQRDYRRCLDALDRYRDLYPNGRLPQDLALLRVRCQRQQGDVSAASREARALFEQEPTAEHLVELLNAQVLSADQNGMRVSLARLLTIDEADGNLLLQGARIAIQVDRDVAVALWRRAVSVESGVPGFAANAALLGSRSASAMTRRPLGSNGWQSRRRRAKAVSRDSMCRSWSRSCRNSGKHRSNSSICIGMANSPFTHCRMAFGHHCLLCSTRTQTTTGLIQTQFVSRRC